MLKRKRILQCNDGVAAVEFALALPFLLVLFLGGFELFRFVLINFKLEKVAYTVSDVVAQQTSITTTQINQIMTVASEIMNPYPFNTEGLIIVSSVYKGVGVAPVVSWQRTGGGTLTAGSKIGTVGQAAALPFGLTLNDKDNVIFAEVFYRYTPLIADDMFDLQNGYKVSVFKPRLGVLTTAPN